MAGMTPTTTPDYLKRVDCPVCGRSTGQSHIERARMSYALSPEGRRRALRMVMRSEHAVEYFARSIEQARCRGCLHRESEEPGCGDPATCTHDTCPSFAGPRPSPEELRKRPLRR